MGNVGFFNESTQQSQAKAAIVSNYFGAWARVIMPSAKKHSNRIAYIDLFAGPGRYKNGTKSTPLLVLEQAIQDGDMRDMLVTYFNDADKNNSNSLDIEIGKLEGIGDLKYKPIIESNIVGEEIVKVFQNTSLVPTLFFVDPWGYKGLSLDLVRSVLKDWGCDCIFFFNYNRINMGLSNPVVREHMNVLFGAKRADSLRAQLALLTPLYREAAIVEELASALRDHGGNYVLPFRFRNDEGNKTSHHLIFVSKHFKGYEIMKDIMYGESSSHHQGVATFEYSPALSPQGILSELNRPVDELADALCAKLKGQTMTVYDIYFNHNVGTPFVLRNYKDAIRTLEDDGRATLDPPAAQRRMRNGVRTVADHVRVTFVLKPALE